MSGADPASVADPTPGRAPGSEVLAFRLHGPMAAWGAPGAAGFERPTATRPGRGAVLGLLAAALGLGHGDEAALAALRDGLWFASASHGALRVRHDFRTAQEAARSARGAPPWRTRREGLAAGVGKTEVGHRQHVEDGLWRVFVAARPGAPVTLARLRDALLAPAFMLSLGRRECPLALPPGPEVVAGGLLDALGAYPPVEARAGRDALARALADLRLRLDRADRGRCLLAWDAGFPGAPEASGAARRVGDDPASRAAWRFRSREEVTATVPVDGGGSAGEAAAVASEGAPAVVRGAVEAAAATTAAEAAWFFEAADDGGAPGVGAAATGAAG